MENTKVVLKADSTDNQTVAHSVVKLDQWSVGEKVSLMAISMVDQMV